MNDLCTAILNEVNKVVVGKETVVSKVLMAILAGGHVLLEDVPGVGKTTLTLAFAAALGLDSRRIQFTSDTVPSDVVGFSVYDKERGGFSYKSGAIMTNILLADEINRTSSKTQSALLEAMEEFNVTVDGVTYPLPEPFVVLATQNPVGSAGTQMLPNSQLDRFIIRLSMGYPDFKSQINILRDRHEDNPLSRIGAVTTPEGVAELVSGAGRVFVSDVVYSYITLLAEATRVHPLVKLGVSPRGALAMSRLAKARAFISGRDFLIPEDVAEIFADVCGHRLVLNSKARLMEMDESAILNEVLSSVDMPVMQSV